MTELAHILKRTSEENYHTASTVSRIDKSQTALNLDESLVHYEIMNGSCLSSLTHFIETILFGYRNFLRSGNFSHLPARLISFILRTAYRSVPKTDHEMPNVENTGFSRFALGFVKLMVDNSRSANSN